VCQCLGLGFCLDLSGWWAGFGGWEHFDWGGGVGFFVSADDFGCFDVEGEGLSAFGASPYVFALVGHCLGGAFCCWLGCG
jgi:hypothetical protein